MGWGYENEDFNAVPRKILSDVSFDTVITPFEIIKARMTTQNNCADLTKSKKMQKRQNLKVTNKIKHWSCFKHIVAMFIKPTESQNVDNQANEGIMHRN